MRESWSVALLALALTLGWPAHPAVACPFCTTPRLTLAQQVDRADAAQLGDAVGADGSTWTLRVQRTLKSSDQTSAGRSLQIAKGSTDGNPASGELLLALGSRKGKQAISWTVVRLNEASFGYLARLPNDPVPSRRLIYFLPFLEHADPLIAEDAWREFAHAPLDEIARLSDRLPVDRLRDWLSDESIPSERKGMYGLLLGLAASAQRRPEIADDFWRWITAGASDFRSGFDGVLGGYLWMGKRVALDRLEKRYLDEPRAAVGDLRHLLTALRVYHDYGRHIASEELMRVYRRFLDVPAVAAPATADLTRWRDWQSLDRVASLFGQAGYDDPATERAVIDYLLACPLPEAGRYVARLRQLLPDRVAAAESVEAAASSDR